MLDQTPIQETTATSISDKPILIANKANSYKSMGVKTVYVDTPLGKLSQAEFSEHIEKLAIPRKIFKRITLRII